MSNYKLLTPRNNNRNLQQILAKYYQNTSFSDVLDYSYEKNIVLGLSGLDRELPILQLIVSNESVKKLLDSLEPNSLVHIDVKNESIFVNGKKVDVYQSLKQDIDSSLVYFNNYGGHLNENGEHIIDLHSALVGSHFGVNLLLGDRSKFNEPLLTTPKSVVDQFGGGSFRGPAANQILATRWDMDPTENGHPSNRQFYLLENGKQIFYSHNIHENVKFSQCVHKVNHTEITYETNDGLRIKRIIYIKPQKKEEEPIALERQVVEVSNLSKEKRNLDIVFTGMFGSANPGCQMVDVIYQTVINQSGVITKDDKVIGITPDYYPKYAQEYRRFFTLSGEGIDEYSYDISNFIGNGSLEHPENITSLGNKLQNKGPSFFAVKKHLEVHPKESVSIVTSTGLIEREKDLGKAIDAVEPCEYKKELKDIQHSFAKYSSFFKVETKNKDFDAYVNNNLPFQVLYQTFVSRSFAQTQKGYREIGFREIQDLYASIPYFVNNHQTKLVEQMLTKWIENIYEFGYANHNFFFVGKEPGMCSDDQIWLILALDKYLKYTNNYSFLKKRFCVVASKKRRTLYDTLKAIIRYSGEISVGKHGLPLLDKADWNDCLKIDDDCLDGPTKEKLYKAQLRKNKQVFGVPFVNDLSESVMNAFLLDIAIKDMLKISKRLEDQEYVNHLNELKEKLESNIQKFAYVDGYFARVLINREDSKYKYVGTPHDGLSITKEMDGSIYLNSFSWALLSDVATEKQIKEMLPLVDKYLKTKAGYKLCTPHDLTLCGSKEAATEQYFLGDRENGGVFKHATMMFVVACLRKVKEVQDLELKKQLEKDADDMLEIVYPFNVLKNPAKLKGNPRFCTQYVNSISEEHIGPILSGTSTWLTLALFEKHLSK